METATQVIPTGYRFHPNDCEIISYLGILLGDDEDRAKETIRSLNNVFQWVDVYSIQPWDLFDKFYNHQIHIGNGGQEKGSSSYLYCISPLKKKTKKGTNIDRTVVVKGSSVPVGTWKSQTTPINIIDSMTGMPMGGVKKQITFVPSTKMEDNQDDSSSNGCSSKKRKNAPEEMEGIRYIMHEYALTPYDDQIYSLCRIRKIIDKKVIINKKMRRSSSPTINTTTASTIVQPIQEERAAGYDHHQQEINSICYNGGHQQQQQQEAVLPPEGDVQIIPDDVKGLADVAEVMELWGVELNEDFFSRIEQDEAATAGGDLLYYGNAGVSEISIHPHGGNNILYNNGQQQQMAGYEHDNQYHHQEVMYDDFVLNYEQEQEQEQQQQQPVVVPAEETATGVSSEMTRHHKENNIDVLPQQQQEADVEEADDQITSKRIQRAYQHQQQQHDEGGTCYIMT